MMKKLFFALSLSLLFINASAQSWSSPDVNAFGPNNVYDYHLDTIANKIYMNSLFGFCIFDISTNQYDTCYAGNNQRFLNNNNPLAYANSKYWIVTSNGISSYDGISFIDYNTFNGLLDNNITDVAIDTSGQLWLASLSGVSRYNGVSFVHDSGIVARQMVIDDSNRVYAFGRVPILVGGPTAFEQIQVKTGNSWTTHTFTGLAAFNMGGGAIYYNDIYKSGDELIIKSSQYNGGYHKLSYPSQIDTVDVKIELVFSNAQIIDMAVDKNGKKWLVSDGSSFRLFSAKDSSFYPQYIKLSAPISGIVVDQVKVYGNHILAYINGHFYKSDISIEPVQVYREEIDVNSIRTGASVLGGLFNDANNFSSGFEIPKGSNFHGIYSANIMVSSKKTGDTNFRMNQTTPFNESFFMGPYNTTSGISGGHWILKVSQQEIQNHIANYTNSNYQMPIGIEEWPANGDTSYGMAPILAPFEDINQNGIYEPTQGEYPKIKGEEAIYWINHKDDFEYHGMLYGFDAPNDSALNQTLFLQYQIFNRSVHFYDSVKMGMFVDFDLGNSADDYMACDSASNTFMVYNGDSFDDAVRGMAGAGANIPFVGLTFLSDSMDGYLQYNIGSASNGDPSSELHWHRYLNSLWKNGNPVTYGGNGFNGPGTSTIPTKYMYTKPGAFWSEDDPGLGVGPNPPGDRRGLGHIPYFSLRSGESKTIEMAVGYALEPNGGRLGSKDKLLNFLDSVSTFWERNLITGIEELTSLDQKDKDFTLYPNPAENRLVIQSKYKGELVQFFTMTGRLVKTERFIQNKQSFNISELTSGLYFIRIGNAVEKLVVN